jgi:uncharacterized membrane protein
MGFSILLSLGVLILVLVFVAQSVKLRERVTNLEWQIFPLNKLANRIKELEDKIAALKLPEEVSKKKEEPAPVTPVTTPGPAAALKPEPIVEPAVQENAPAESARKPVYEFEPPKSRTREEWESFIGGKLLNRIGALALIIGIGLFLKLAFENNWISETVRVLIGAAAGFLCLGFAYRTNKKGFQTFAQGLVGAGISILYLSVYASFNYYSLVPQWVAFILMSLVTILSLAIGLYYNSLAVGMLGWAGGFLTPIMLSTGIVNEIGLFTYIALLNVGLLAVVFAKKEWQIIEPLTLAGTWIMFFSWCFRYYHEPDLIVTVFFISVFWALFFGLDGARLRLTGIVNNAVHHVVAAFNLVLFYSTLYVLVNKEHHSWMGVLTLLLACIYIGTFFWLRRSGISTDVVKIRYALSTIALAVIATSIQFEDFTTVLLWSIEVALLVWCGVHWKQRFVYFAATALFAITALKFLYTNGAFEYEPIDQFAILFNLRCLTLAVMALAFGASAWFMKSAGQEGEGLSSIFHTAWCMALFILCTVETNDFFRLKIEQQPVEMFEHLNYLRPLVLALVWCALSLPLVWISLREKLLPVLISGLSILTLSTCFIVVRGLEFQPIADFQLIFNIRTGAILLALGAMFVHQWSLKSYRDAIPWLVKISDFVRIGIVVLILVLLTGETIDYFEKQIVTTQATGDELWRLNNLRQLSLSGIWLLYSVALMAFGFWRSLRSFRIIAFVLFGFTILKIFIYDLSYLETLYRIFSFIGLGVILITVSFVYQKYKDIIFGTSKEKAV